MALHNQYLIFSGIKCHLKKIIRFLCDQNKWLVYVGLIASQVLVAADIETLILSPQVTLGRAFVGVVATELLAAIVIAPCFLLLFGIIARFATLLGVMRATMLTIVIIVAEELLTRTTQQHTLIAVVLAIDIALWTLMGSVILFIVKGREPFFQGEVVADELRSQDSVLKADISQPIEDFIPDQLPSALYETKSSLLRERVTMFIEADLKIPIPFFALALLVGGSVAYNQYPFHNRTDQDAQVMNEDSAEIAAIVAEIKANGPRELRQLPSSVITDSARSFVMGKRTGVISAAQLAHLGGVRAATELSLMGQLKALGQ